MGGGQKMWHESVSHCNERNLLMTHKTLLEKKPFFHTYKCTWSMFDDGSSIIVSSL